MNRKILLDEKDIPRQWYNLAADLPTPPLPPLGPDGKPIGPEMLAPERQDLDTFAESMATIVRTHERVA